MDYVFDPKTLVSAPYVPCPFCGRETFGVLLVGGQRYVRRCTTCWKTGEFALPTLRKKVIYLDQFAISNMMKALNVAVKSHARAAADPFWLELYEALERVCKLQLAVCPHSCGHLDESLASAYFTPLKRMYEHLSGGIGFLRFEQIVHHQLLVAVDAWIKGNSPEYDFNPEQVVDGKLNGWQDRLMISVNIEYPQAIIDDILRVRDEVHSKMVELFTKRRESTNVDFDHWLRTEETYGARAILEARQLFLERLRQLVAGESDGEPYSSHGHDRYLVIEGALQRSGVTRELMPEKFAAFLHSATLHAAPANKIQSLMWAVLSHRAVSANGGPPNRGMVNDINAMSSLLPYCDAMFVDRGCAGILDNIPNRRALPYATKIFSPGSRADFLAYLGELEREEAGLRAVVENVYGPDWLKPYVDLYPENSSSISDEP